MRISPTYFRKFISFETNIFRLVLSHREHTILQIQRHVTTILRRGCADKSLARPGRKQATATKLGIYSTRFPRRSIHYLARFSNFCKLLKKNSESCPSNQVSAAAIRGQIRRIGWVMKTFEAQAGQFLRGCKCPVRRGTVVQEQGPLGDIPAAYYLKNVLQLHQQRWVILRVDSLALWKKINEVDVVLIPKKSRWELFQRIFALEFFLGGRGEPICRHSFDGCFVSGS